MVALCNACEPRTVLLYPVVKATAASCPIAVLSFDVLSVKAA